MLSKQLDSSLFSFLALPCRWDNQIDVVIARRGGVCVAAALGRASWLRRSHPDGACPATRSTHAGTNGSLLWMTRMKIAVVTAKGLAFLHDANLAVIYKASNILLYSGQFEPPWARRDRGPVLYTLADVVAVEVVVVMVDLTARIAGGTDVKKRWSSRSALPAKCIYFSPVLTIVLKHLSSL